MLALPRVAAGLPDGVRLFAKAEFLNPTGSVKDRAAFAIVRQARDANLLGSGRILIDASSGNTGISYAMLGARLGFPVKICLPRNASPERIARLQAYGAEILFTDPAEGTDGAQREAARVAAEDPTRYYYPDQYNHPANPGAHYASTGPEIWRQTEGHVTHFVTGVGTGGTISGVGRFLKEHSPAIRVVGVEPSGPLHGIEGLKHLPTALRPSTYDGTLIDETLRVDTEAALEMQSQLAREEGLSVGASAGAAVWAALRVGRANPGAIVVTILPDGGHGPADGGPP